MSAVELITLLISSGVASGGIGVLRWAFTIEKRLTVIEAKQQVTHHA